MTPPSCTKLEFSGSLGPGHGTLNGQPHRIDPVAKLLFPGPFLAGPEASRSPEAAWRLRAQALMAVRAPAKAPGPRELPAPSCEDTARGHGPEERSHVAVLAPSSPTCRLQKGEHYVSALYEPPSLWSVVAA